MNPSLIFELKWRFKYLLFLSFYLYRHILSYDMIYLFAFVFLSPNLYCKFQKVSHSVLEVLYKHTALQMCTVNLNASW